MNRTFKTILGTITAAVLFGGFAAFTFSDALAGVVAGVFALVIVGGILLAVTTPYTRMEGKARATHSEDNDKFNIYLDPIFSRFPGNIWYEE
ncbi:hypothetical protein [Geobacter sp. SVR]|uniref:hypothetical protein n=1 Tax=Geobacter sp. SVR TaxID=2495594 RepID=UPI00143EF4B7|nr:hypothetical protein [Geobacter sp. SVR]BCS52654.1 hypothetical protein GSVR_09620 [Geobacter sp. SVR]GCF83908.1 hypothetical protein GSbR_05080 [Geobacter sp. SVR]